MTEDNDLEFEEEATPTLALKKLRDQLKTCQTERQEFLDTSQRLRADYVNLKRDTETSRTELTKFANQKLLLDLIGLADHFDQALATEGEDNNWRRGLEQIYASLQKIFKHYHVTSFSPIGEAFNPAEHQAVGTVDTVNPDEDNIISEVLQPGYKLYDKIIRPANVKIWQKS